MQNEKFEKQISMSFSLENEKCEIIIPNNCEIGIISTNLTK